MSFRINIVDYTRYGRYILRAIFLIYIVWITPQLINEFRQNPSMFIHSSLPYNILFSAILFAVLDVLISYVNHFLTDSIRNLNERIIGTTLCYNAKLTLDELATKLQMKENELEMILANINTQGEYYVQIDKETKVVSITSMESLVGPGTAEEKLRKLEILLKEGKISQRTYDILKEKYSKEIQIKK
jgi:hypothetical protein